MTSILNIKQLILAGLCALAMGISLSLPAQASASVNGSSILRPAFGDGQETHGGPKRTASLRIDGGQETHGGPKRGGDGQETHGGPK